MAFLSSVNRLLKAAVHHKRPKSLDVSLAELHEWSETPMGKAVLQEQAEQLQDILGDLFGYHMLELSSLRKGAMQTSTRIGHTFRMSPTQGFGAEGVAEFDQLPLPDDSIDVVLLHHLLEFTSNPHQVLREASRVLIPRGYVVIVGFNPYSLQGMCKFVAQWFSRKAFWRRHSLRPARLVDWLQVLDCELVSLQRGFYRPPLNSERLLSACSPLEKLGRSLGLPLGGYYVLLARKDCLTLTPIKPVWSKLNPVAGLVMGEPAPRVSQCSRRDKLH